MALQLRPKHRTLPYPSLVRFFSASRDASAAPPDDSSHPSPHSQSSSTSDSFGEIKATLRQPPPHHQQQQQYERFRRPAAPFSGSRQPPPVSKVASLEEIRKNLSEFRRRSAAPGPADSHSSPPQAINLKGLLKRDVNPPGVEQSEEKARSVSHLSLEAILQSLTNLKNNAGSRVDKVGKDPMSLKSFQDTLRMKPNEGSPSFGMPVIGGTDKLPVSVFGKEMGEQKEKASQGSAMRTEFLKMYNYEDLGEKLRMLRPETAGKGKVEFSLEELNERLAKLRENEEKEIQERMGGLSFKDLRDTLASLRLSESEKSKKLQSKRLYILGQMSQTQDYMMHPPKEHLLEQYFHPDNMSSEEKMKIELAKVRDEFKMSESDCGSARVQVAQLTTKIKHLSSVLHKKDKHSRKGLEGMIQRRKKLLKYLRRTDWDSYCLVLSKLGLRDNPGLKLS